MILAIVVEVVGICYASGQKKQVEEAVSSERMYMRLRAPPHRGSCYCDNVRYLKKPDRLEASLGRWLVRWEGRRAFDWYFVRLLNHPPWFPDRLLSGHELRCRRGVYLQIKRAF